jgi:hypothetical protein
VVVSVDLASLVCLETSLVKLKTLCEGVTTNRNEDNIGLELLLFTIFSFDIDNASLFSVVNTVKDLCV